MNGAMILGLALEYVSQLNDKETPTVMTALDRVVSQESQRIIDDLKDEYKVKIADQLKEDALNDPESDISATLVFQDLRLMAMRQIHEKLNSILSVDEVITRHSEFMKWMDKEE